MSALHSLACRYAAAHPQAVANRLQELAADVAATFIAGLEPPVAAAVVAQLWPRTAAAILDHLALDDTSEILAVLDLSRTVTLLRQLPVDARDPILSALPPALEPRVRKALSFPAGTVGSAADLAVLPYDADSTVDKALARGSDAKLPYLYVIDREYRLVGVIHRSELENSPKAASLRSIMKSPVQRVPATTPLAILHHHGAWSTVDALPVVDARDGFLGVIRHKALRAAPPTLPVAPEPATALAALLDLGEVYWSGLFSAIEVLAEGGERMKNGDLR